VPNGYRKSQRGAAVTNRRRWVDGYINKRAVYYSIATCMASVVVVHLCPHGRRPGQWTDHQHRNTVAAAGRHRPVYCVANVVWRVLSRRAAVPGPITASFLLTFLVMMSFALTLPEFAKSTQSEFMTQIQHNFFSVWWPWLVSISDRRPLFRSPKQ